MQHPVGIVYNPETKRAELDSIRTVLTNPTTLAAFPHTVTAALVTAATFVAGIAGWWMIRNVRKGNEAEAAVYRPALKLALVALVIGGVGVAISGDIQARLMFQQQPMKMASAEALCDSESGAGFSLFAIGDVQNNCDVKQITVPGLTSFMATGDFNGDLKGVNELRAEYVQKYGAYGTDGSGYVPLLPVTYWTFRLMIGFGVFSALLAIAGLWYTRSSRSPTSSWFGKLAIIAVPMPFLANATGWIFTEMGRQPWIVAPNPKGDANIRMTVDKAVSPIVFTLLYGLLAVVWFGLMKRYTVEGAPVVAAESDQESEEKPLAFAY
jgi:cytochrome d ubiquinol oxidase subunit I